MTGVLTPRASQFDRVSDLTSYESISRMLREAQSIDPAAIMLEFDTPGGSVIDLEETALEIFSARINGSIPIVAMARLLPLQRD